jgi:hypothetical protein
MRAIIHAEEAHGIHKHKGEPMLTAIKCLQWIPAVPRLRYAPMTNWINNDIMLNWTRLRYDMFDCLIRVRAWTRYIASGSHWLISPTLCAVELLVCFKIEYIVMPTICLSHMEQPRVLWKANWPIGHVRLQFYLEWLSSAFIYMTDTYSSPTWTRSSLR